MLTIGRLAREAGMHVETIRYYQRRGLIMQPQRPLGGVRRYGPDTQARLKFTKRAQQLGFTLEEVKVLLRLGQTPNCRDARALAAAKLQLVESRIRDLARMRTSLRSLIRQCDQGGRRTCAIIENLGSD